MLRLVFIACFLVARPAFAQSWRAEAARDGDDPRAIVELVSDVASIEPGGELRVGVRFELDPHWHVYWKNPGQAAFATDVQLSGVELGPLQWPAPERFEAAGGFVTTYGYDEEALLFAEGRISEEAAEIELRAVVDFLVCKVDCIPDRVELTHNIPVGERAPVRTELFERYAALVPQPGNAMLELAALPGPTQSARATLIVPCQGCEVSEPKVAFISERIESLTVVSSAASASESEIRIELELEAGADPPSGERRLRGVARMLKDGQAHFREIDLPLEATISASTPAGSSPSSMSLISVLLLALLGGLILNLMPCVLPVLAIKVVGLAQLAESEGSAAKQAAGYAIGVLLSMLTLAAVVVSLRAAGTELGWGFQLQEPSFVAFLIALLVAFALHLFGVFRFTVSVGALATRLDKTQGLGRSVGEGVLAVVLATPCSAPFLGTAVGFALSAEGPTIFGVFVCIGLGLAFPFALAAMVPALRRRIPKPGAWSHTLEQLLAFALLGTAVWLSFVLAQLGGALWIAKGLGVALVVGFAAWLYGAKPSRKRGLIAIVLLAGAIMVGLRPEQDPTLTWEVWSPERVADAQASGETVFVDFTADWCITCKANESLVLESEDVRDALSDVRLLKADWTRRDEGIRRALAAHGRGGVPLYLVYRPSEPEPQVLPELLTAGIVLDALGD